MTYSSESFMVTESQGTRPAGRPSERLARYLRSQYRRDHQIKRLAEDISSTPKAAENILKGHWPGDLHFAAIVRRFGADVLEAVFAPEIEPVLARLSQEERELEERLELVRAHRRQAAGRREGDLEPRAATERAKRAPEG